MIDVKAIISIIYWKMGKSAMLKTANKILNRKMKKYVKTL